MLVQSLTDAQLLAGARHGRESHSPLFVGQPPQNPSRGPPPHLLQLRQRGAGFGREAGAARRVAARGRQLQKLLRQSGGWQEGRGLLNSMAGGAQGSRKGAEASSAALNGESSERQRWLEITPG